MKTTDARKHRPYLLISAVSLAFVLGGCVEVKPEHIRLNGQDYIQSPATKAPPLAGLPNMGPHQLIPLTAEAEKQQTRHIPVWGCTAFDFGTTAIGLAAGIAEANPLGILIAPIAFIANRAASSQAKNGDTTAATVSSVTHCAAGVANLAALL